MIVFVFGNPDLNFDNLPIKILPELEKKLPEIEFKILDPNEEWNLPKDIVLIDTIIGIKKVKVFDDLKYFSRAPRISMHDFDAFANLQLLKKLGKLKSVKIIGVPSHLSENKAVNKIEAILKNNI